MFIKLYLIALPIFFTIDIVWLGLLAKNFYAKYLGFLLTANINWLAAIIFYLLFILGLVKFVINPALTQNSWQNALLNGALFGLITYATYDLTNLATIKDWPLIVSTIDIIWGATLGAIVSATTYFIASKFTV